VEIEPEAPPTSAAAAAATEEESFLPVKREDDGETTEDDSEVDDDATGMCMTHASYHCVGRMPGAQSPSREPQYGPSLNVSSLRGLARVS
jgi:hypothetical protein